MLASLDSTLDPRGQKGAKMSKYILCLVAWAWICFNEVDSQLRYPNDNREEYTERRNNRHRDLSNSTIPASTLVRAKSPGIQQHHVSRLSIRTGDARGACVCVPYYECSTKPVVHQEEGDCEVFHSRRIGLRLSNQQCENALDACCPNDNVIRKGQTPCPASKSDVSGVVPATEPPDEEHTTNSPSSLSRCGKRNSEGVGFSAIGGVDESQFGEFPWMVAIALKKRGIPLYQCGGSLISDSVVLTAAHCVDGHQPDQLIIRVGEWDTQTTGEQYQHQDLSVTSVVVHDKYKPTTLFNDVALLFLESSVQPDVHIGTICLPSVGTVFDRRRCFVSGWGRDLYGQAGVSRAILKKRDLPIVPNRQCQTELQKTRLGARFKLDESFICAGGEPGIDACTGDGGSPLVCPLFSDPSTYEQAGIVAWGIGCGDNETPGVYVDVARFRTWIDGKLVVKNIDSYSYTP